MATESRDQVIFDAVAKSYPTDAHVECRYTMKPSHISSTYDWVGLFKVGWSNMKEFAFYHWVPYPRDRAPDSEYSHSILFQSVHLPKEDGEYYQFVYFNDKGKMCGASSPFYFHVPRHDDIVEVVMQEDEDMLYITTRRGQLEDKKIECAKLTKTCEAMNQEIHDLSEQVKVAVQNMAELKEDNRVLRDKVEELEPNAEELIIKERQLEDKEQVEKELVAEKDKLQSQLDTLKMEQTLLLDQIKLAEDSTVEQIEAFKKKLEDAVPDKEAFETLQAQLSSSQETVEALEQRKRQQKELIDEQHDKLQATEARHHVDKQEIASLNETLTNLSVKVEEVNTGYEELKTKYNKVNTRYETEKTDWAATLLNMEKEKNSLLSTIGELNHKLEHVQERTVSAESYDIQEDRYIALQAAYSLLKDELREQKKSHDTLQRREKRHRAASTAQIDELKEKLKESEEEYTKLGTQKVKLEKRLKAAAKIGSTSSDGSPLKRTMSAAARDELTREELLKMVEQLSAELESRTQKKDRYKDKYLDEKQRAATLRDYYKGEGDKLRADLALARAQLDSKVTTPSPSVGRFSYPEVSASKANEHGVARYQLISLEHNSAGEVIEIAQPPIFKDYSEYITSRYDTSSSSQAKLSISMNLMGNAEALMDRLNVLRSKSRFHEQNSSVCGDVSSEEDTDEASDLELDESYEICDEVRESHLQKETKDYENKMKEIENADQGFVREKVDGPSGCWSECKPEPDNEESDTDGGDTNASQDGDSSGTSEVNDGHDVSEDGDYSNVSQYGDDSNASQDGDSCDTYEVNDGSNVSEDGDDNNVSEDGDDSNASEDSDGCDEESDPDCAFILSIRHGYQPPKIVEKGAQAKKQRAHGGAGTSGASGDKTGKGALEQSIVGDLTDKLTPLPAPIEPIRTHTELKMDNHTPQATSSPHHSSVPYPSAIHYPMEKKKVREEVVMPHQSDSDDDNEGTDRFHDAEDNMSGMIKCFICDKVFGLHDTEEMRNAHACEHLDATISGNPSMENYQCPICKQEFKKSDITIDDFQAHANAHFTQTQ